MDLQNENILITNTSLPINASPEKIVSVQHLYKSFGKNNVLVDFNLEVVRGESVVVLGKSGSGKSVLIKCIIGLLKPDKGDITLFGKNILTMDERTLDNMRMKIGFLFQSNALYDSMTVRENLEFPLRRHRINLTPKEVEQMVTESLEDVGLSHTIDMMPAELSGGMRKRIALARTLILKPEIILYDEPTTGLDPVTAKEIITLMRAVQQKYATTSIIISHDLNCVKLAGTRVVILIDGACYISASFNNLKQSTDSKVKQFFEGGES